MCAGWCHPPDVLRISQISTAPSGVLAATFVKRLATMSSQVTPLIVHSPFWRTKSIRRVIVASDSLSSIVGWFGLSWSGISLSAPSKGSSVTTNWRALSVLVKLIVFFGAALRSVIRSPAWYLAKSMTTS